MWCTMICSKNIAASFVYDNPTTCGIEHGSIYIEAKIHLVWTQKFATQILFSLLASKTLLNIIKVDIKTGLRKPIH